MKKIIVVIVFVIAIFSLNACKSTNSCTSVEKQEIKNNVTKTNTNLEVNT